jgi:hypothetical protein
MTEQHRNVLNVVVCLGFLVAGFFGADAWQSYRYHRHACEALQSKVLDQPSYKRSDFVLESCGTASFMMVPNRKHPDVEDTLVTIFASSAPGMSWRRIAFSARVDKDPRGRFVDDVQLVGSDD